MGTSARASPNFQVPARRGSRRGWGAAEGGEGGGARGLARSARVRPAIHIAVTEDRGAGADSRGVPAGALPVEVPPVGPGSEAAWWHRRRFTIELAHGAPN